MVIKACPKCGSTQLDMPGFQDGVVPEIDVFNDYVCQRCGLRAVPLEFDRESDYTAFVEGLEAS